jgi:hypothetical protein
LYCTIILSGRIIQFKTDPFSFRKVGGTDEAHRRLSSIGQLDHRAYNHVLPGHREWFQEPQ